MDKFSELKQRREALSQKSNMRLENMDTIIRESDRVAQVASNSRAILDDLERDFEAVTGLDSLDVKFLFFCNGSAVCQTVLFSE
ncbi:MULTISPECIES: hypothetical protein [Paenibacillus]|uniref:hypothetical protein n=1 Tax=Paenibacillus TaxID=44249 RepID=UPI000FDB1302|nr:MULTISPECIES: hypothetical protein [Paenibacillus]MED4606821.1 hypothetical protein [Paenibacillus validus]